MACSNSKKIFFCFFNNQEKSQTPWKSFGFYWFWWFFPSKALSTRLYNSVLIIWIGSIFASSNTEKFFLRQSLRPKKSHFWRKLTKSSDFWAFSPPDFQNNYTFVFKILFNNCTFFSNSYFPQKTSYVNNWQNQNKLTLHQFHVWGKITKSLDFWEFFSPNFQNNCTFFCKLLFSQENFILERLAKSE